MDEQLRQAIADALMRKQGFIYPGVPQGAEGTPGPDQVEQIARQQEAHKRKMDRALVPLPYASIESYPAEERQIARQYRLNETALIPSADEIWEAAKGYAGAAGDAAAGIVGATGGPPGAVVTSTVRAGQRYAPSVMESLEWLLRVPQTGTSVPKVDARPAMEDARIMRDTVAGNPHVQAIKGRQGFPTKAEQQELLEKAIERGARLPEPGPWGYDPAEIRKAIAEALARLYPGKQ